MEIMVLVAYATCETALTPETRYALIRMESSPVLDFVSRTSEPPAFAVARIHARFSSRWSALTSDRFPSGRSINKKARHKGELSCLSVRWESSPAFDILSHASEPPTFAYAAIHGCFSSRWSALTPDRFPSDAL